ncbi:hypothetical protein B0I35DRAFT_446538 [Stachybotrys elegans]|uniref:Zn(2)-C6 fungal-type domain-containing protein n=1 Tax=Stachybotrys elegans TaxID=80388 RepID=A0A8K0SDL4_9HYPO|nr:hypothetical protein B0I35DRAFT_446538 [Stachybotrys elegans]
MATSAPQSPLHQGEGVSHHDSDSASAQDAVSGKRKRDRTNNDGPPLAAACDQCRVRKVRCDRLPSGCSNCHKSGIECSTSYMHKRVNHTKQLRDDFSLVLKRLDQVDTTLATLTSLVQQIATRPSCDHHNSDPQTSSIDHPMSLPAPGSVLDQPSVPEPFTSEISFYGTLGPDGGGNPIYGYPSVPAMAEALLRQVSSYVFRSYQHSTGGDIAIVPRALQSSHVETALRERFNDFPFMSECLEPSVASDTNSIATPPAILCQLFIDGYLDNINSRTPIFGQAELRDAVKSHYTQDENAQDTKAWSLIINNVILLELGLEMQAAQAEYSNYGINEETLPSLLRNCDRAIRDLNTLMVPNLVSIQALMTLVLVAQEFYSHATAQRICHAACRTCLTLGLHRSGGPIGAENSEPGQSGISARQRLFQILYSMDKQRVFMTGLPCDLHMFDSDFPMFSDPFTRLTNIWEDIYLKLYTPRAAWASTETRAGLVYQLSGSLDDYYQKYVKSLPVSQGSNGEGLDPTKIELAYGFLVSQVLVLRCNRNDENGQAKMRELARKSLEVVVTVSTPPLTTQRLALLSNIIRNYPLVAFFDLASYHISGIFETGEVSIDARADLALLRALCEQIPVPEHGKLAHVFSSCLKAGLHWALDILEVLVEALRSNASNMDSIDDLPRALSQEPSDPVVPQLLLGCPVRLPTLDHDDSRLPPAYVHALPDLSAPGHDRPTDHSTRHTFYF